MEELLWDKKEHHFGNVKYDSTHYVDIKYLGEDPINVNNFVVNCSCTTKSYNLDTKTVTFGLHMNQLGSKISIITVNLPSGKQDLLLLKATVQ